MCAVRLRRRSSLGRPSTSRLLKRALVIGVTTDILFPSRQQREIAELMRDTGTEVEYVEIDSANGHDAFLIDDAHFSPVVKKFLDESVN